LFSKRSKRARSRKRSMKAIESTVDCPQAGPKASWWGRNVAQILPPAKRQHTSEAGEFHWHMGPLGRDCNGDQQRGGKLGSAGKKKVER